MKAVICPVCGGSGKYNKEPPSVTTGMSFQETCHGCIGTGWVSVVEEQLTYCPVTIPTSPYIPSYPYPNLPYPITITYG